MSNQNEQQRRLAATQDWKPPTPEEIAANRRQANKEALPPTTAEVQANARATENQRKGIPSR